MFLRKIILCLIGLIFGMSAARAQSTLFESDNAYGFYEYNGIRYYRHSFYGRVYGGKEIEISAQFDIGKIGAAGRSETANDFTRIWEAFRKTHDFNDGGEFVDLKDGNAADNKFSQNAFLYLVNQSHPSVIVSAVEQCKRCAGQGSKRTLVDNPDPKLRGTTMVGDVPCGECWASGSIKVNRTFFLSYTGALPERLLPPPKPKAASKPVAQANNKAPTVSTPTSAPTAQSELAIPSSTAGLRPAPTLEAERRLKILTDKALAGDVEIQFLLGKSYFSGNGVPKDIDESFKWYKMAAKHGLAVAQLSLGIAYDSGFGAPKDFIEAYAWYNIAAARNNEAIASRITLEKTLSSDQINEGQKRTKEILSEIEKLKNDEHVEREKQSHLGR
ncbi:MAG: sel1 repeat family protein [Opitutales bacterium]|jgi:hypothetical protein|nr:MAG: sel1 repeat family protein [Opitutales bacterium]